VSPVDVSAAINTDPASVPALPLSHLARGDPATVSVGSDAGLCWHRGPPGAPASGPSSTSSPRQDRLRATNRYLGPSRVRPLSCADRHDLDSAPALPRALPTAPIGWPVLAARSRGEAVAAPALSVGSWDEKSYVAVESGERWRRHRRRQRSAAASATRAAGYNGARMEHSSLRLKRSG